MMLSQVIEGLKKGYAYRRDIGQVVETLRPTGHGGVEHEVASLGSGGGGVSAIPIETLNNGRWPVDGWTSWTPENSR